MLSVCPRVTLAMSISPFLPPRRAPWTPCWTPAFAIRVSVLPVSQEPDVSGHATLSLGRPPAQRGDVAHLFIC